MYHKPDRQPDITWEYTQGIGVDPDHARHERQRAIAAARSRATTSKTYVTLDIYVLTRRQHNDLHSTETFRFDPEGEMVAYTYEELRPRRNKFGGDKEVRARRLLDDYEIRSLI